MKIGVLLSGSGVYDGSEIHESVFALLAISENGADAVCIAPNVPQHHVINHMTGDEMNETRNVLVESARICRGDIKDIKEITVNSVDALVLPGGFGAAKNLTKWALNGPDGAILPEVKRIINEFVNAGKPVAGLCMGPTVIAKALENSNIHASLTVGSTKESSQYDIAAISQGMEKCGATAELKTIREIAIDTKNKIISAPCYMMDGTLVDIRNNIKMAIDALVKMVG